MKIKFGLSLLVLLLVLSACQQNAPAQPVPTLTPVPGVNATQALPPATAAPAVAPSATSAVVAPATLAPTVAAPANTPVPSETASPVPNASPTKAPVRRPTATVTSSGPLSAQVYVVPNSCHSAPTPGKPGNVTFQISVEAKGGNGVYQYTYNSTTSKNKFIDMTWEKGTRLLGTVTVTSGDGQSFDVVLNINIADLTCSA